MRNRIEEQDVVVSPEQPKLDQIGGSIQGSESSSIFTGLALSGDGSTLAIGASDHDDSKGSVRVYRYNASDGEFKEALTVQGHASGDKFGYSVALSSSTSNKCTLAVGVPGDGTVSLYSLDFLTAESTMIGKISVSTGEGEEIQFSQRDIPEDVTFDVDISADGTALAISLVSCGSRNVKLYNYSNDQWEFDTATDLKPEFSLSDDGKRLAYRYADKICLFTYPNAEQCKPDLFANQLFAISGDGLILVAVSGTSILLYQLDEAGFALTELGSVAGQGAYNFAAISYDGTTITLGGTDSFNIGFVEQYQYNGQELMLFSTTVFESAKFGKVVASSNDGNIIASESSIRNAYVFKMSTFTLVRFCICNSFPMPA